MQSRADPCRAIAFSTEMTALFRCQAWECEILFTPQSWLDTPGDAQWGGRWLEADGSPWEDLELHSLAICVLLAQR